MFIISFSDWLFKSTWSKPVDEIQLDIAGTPDK